MKEEKKLYKMMKNFGEGGVGKGSNFTLKFFDIFAIVKCVAFLNYRYSSRNRDLSVQSVDVFFNYFATYYKLGKIVFGVKLHKNCKKMKFQEYLSLPLGVRRSNVSFTILCCELRFLIV